MTCAPCVTSGSSPASFTTTADALPPLTEEKLCKWAEAHWRQTENWPNENSGPVQAAPGETWGNVNAALREGLRGLPGGEFQVHGKNFAGAGRASVTIGAAPAPLVVGSCIAS